MKWPLLLLVLGCDAQVGDSYRGEPMARFEGTVVANGTPPPLPVDAALLWQPRGTATVATAIVVEKSFPAHFKMTILLPPPLDVVYAGHSQALLSAVSHTASAEDLAAGRGIYGTLDSPRVHFFEQHTAGLLARQYGSLERGYHLIARTQIASSVTQAEVDACAAELQAYGDQSQLCRDELLRYREDDLPFDTALILEVSAP